MLTTLRRSLLMTALFLAFAPAAGGQPLKPEQLGRAGKAAAAVFRAPDGFATAFCIHSSGLFVTSDGAARRAGESGTVALVLDPGLKTERALRARLVRSDAQAGLALLRVEGAEKLPALGLGSDEQLSELTEVAVFGYPYAKEEARRKEYPAVAVQLASVTSLHRKGGELVRFELDEGQNPGYLGGPVLDRGGKLVGMVAGPADGARGSVAVPARVLARFLARPDLQMKAPRLVRPALEEPALFEVQAITPAPGARPLALELVLRVEQGRERRFKMDYAEGAYRVKAPPVAADEMDSLPVTVQYDGDAVRGRVADRGFKVGDKEFRLYTVRRLRGFPHGQVLLRDGKTIEGTLTGLSEVPVKVGDETLWLDLAKAVEVRLEPPPRVTAVTYTVIAARDGKEVERVSGTLAVAEPDGREPGTLPVIQPPALAEDRVVVPLSSPAADLAVGGGGRYLILHLPKERRLAVFDVNVAKVVHAIPVEDANVTFAAGANKLLVVHGDSNTIQRWDLTAFEKEASAALPVPGPVQAVSMGSASRGPLLVHCTEGKGVPRPPSRSHWIDPQTLSLLRPDPRPGGLAGYALQIRASADGSVFGSWTPNITPTGIRTLVRTGDEYQPYGEHKSTGFILPTPNGRYLFTTQGVYTNQVRLPDKDAFVCQVGIPAHHGPYYLNLRTGNKDYPGQYVGVLGSPKPLFPLRNVELHPGGDPPNKPDPLAGKRTHLIPRAKLIVTLPPSSDRLIVQRLDIDEQLERHGGDYLFVASESPVAARKGTTFRYQLEVKSRKGGLSYAVTAGPKGMTVSPKGEVSWPVPADFAGGEQRMGITVRDAAGQEFVHAFNVRIEG